MKNMIAELAQKYECFYLYNENCIIEHTNRLKNDFPQVAFLYSIKCNANQHVIKSVFSQGFGADAASLGEVVLAVKSGLAKNQIYYSAPGKTLLDIEQSMEKAMLIADSIHEIRLINRVAEKRNLVVKIGVRINPDFSFYSDGGCSSKFGVDEKQIFDFLAYNDCSNIKIAGIHVHIRSQELNADILAAYYKNIFLLAEKFQKANKNMLEFINMGSGMGIEYSSKDVPLNTELLGKMVNEHMKAFSALNPETKIIIEVGRYAVGKSGVYVTTVLDKKVSYGKTYLILKNTLNGFIRPSLAKLVEKYASETAPVASEPLFTCKDAFEFLTLKEELNFEKVTLVGNLCTATDLIMDDIMLPHLECGDIIIITNAGSYASVLSPMQFSSQEKPAELFMTRNEEILS
jgi:diaminopimelate decarboxylase